MEVLGVQRYQQNGFFKHHHDSFDTAPALGDRKTTFNVYLDGNCTGGGIHFPRLSMPDDRGWCEFVDCEASEPGVVFKAIAGNAIYWQNFGDDGVRHPATLHAGLPVLSGRKIGMNIWTWLIP